MSKETEILHRISQARNKRNAPGTDELLKDCDIFIKEYGDLVDSHCTKNIDELHTQIAGMATKLTVSEDERLSGAISDAKLRGEIEHLEAERHELNSRIEALKKPKRKRRTKAQMAKARSNEQSAKESKNRESQPLH